MPKPALLGAVQASLPEALSPQLATLTSVIPNAGEWLYEIKLDGYRLMTRFESGKPALITRRGKRLSAKMPVLVKELANLDIEPGWLDGELVVLRDNGVPDSNALQNVFDRGQGGDDIVRSTWDRITALPSENPPIPQVLWATMWTAFDTPPPSRRKASQPIRCGYSAPANRLPSALAPIQLRKDSSDASYQTAVDVRSGGRRVPTAPRRP